MATKSHRRPPTSPTHAFQSNCTKDHTLGVNNELALLQVYKVVMTESQNCAALRVLTWPDDEAAPMAACAERVIPELQALSSTHMVATLGGFVGSDHIALVQEIMPNGDLWTAMLSGGVGWGARCLPPIVYVAVGTRTPRQNSHSLHLQERGIARL